MLPQASMGPLMENEDRLEPKRLIVVNPGGYDNRATFALPKLFSPGHSIFDRVSRGFFLVFSIVILSVAKNLVR